TLPQGRQFPRRVGLYDLAASAYGQPGLDALPAARGPGRAGDRGRRESAAGGGGDGEPQSDAGGGPDCSGQGGEPVAAGVSCGLCAARCGGARARGGGEAPGLLGRDIKVPTPQGQNEAATSTQATERAAVGFQ